MLRWVYLATAVGCTAMALRVMFTDWMPDPEFVAVVALTGTSIAICAARRVGL